MSGRNPPAWNKRNAVTERADYVASLNRQFGTRAGGGGVPDDMFQPSAPADLMNVPTIGDAPAPLIPAIGPDAAAALEAEWAAANGPTQGIAGHDPNDDITEGGRYGAAQDRAIKPNRQTAREFLAAQRHAMAMVPDDIITRSKFAPATPPDLTKIDGIDFKARTIIVDGVPFKYLPDSHFRLLRFTVDFLREAILAQLEAAFDIKEPSVPDTQAAVHAPVQPPSEPEGGGPSTSGNPSPPDELASIQG